jgi:hypothetical protein
MHDNRKENEMLWAVLIPGPDDVIAMPSKEAAVSAAYDHNLVVDADTWPIPDRRDAYRAVVIEWPHDAESHALAVHNTS